MTVDDGERRAELVRGHRHEILLLGGQTALGGQGLAQRFRLSAQGLLAQHQLDRVIAEHQHRARHFPDLVAPARALDLDMRLVGGQAMHALRQVEQWIGDRERDEDDRRHQAKSRQQNRA